MHVTIAHVHENLFDGEADELSIPTADGVVTILSHHQPLVTTLRPGVATVRMGASMVAQIPVQSGILEVSGNQAVVLL